MDSNEVEREAMDLAWIRKAAAEFLIIVVGVLVALAVDGWREDRVERGMEREYLERLLVDLQAGQDNLVEDGLQHLQGAEQNMRRVGPFLRYGDPVPGDTTSFIAALNGATQSLFYRLAETYPNTAFEELWSTGGFTLITDPGIRSAIISHYSLVEASSGQLDLQPREYRDLLRGQIPGELQESIRTQCDLREPGFTCHFDYGRFDVQRFLRGLQGNREASAALELSLQQTLISIPFVEELIESEDRLIQLIGEELTSPRARIP